jgi:hypothetical protein
MKVSNQLAVLGSTKRHCRQATLQSLPLRRITLKDRTGNSSSRSAALKVTTGKRRMSQSILRPRMHSSRHSETTPQSGSASTLVSTSKDHDRREAWRCSVPHPRRLRSYGRCRRLLCRYSQGRSGNARSIGDKGCDQSRRYSLLACDEEPTDSGRVQPIHGSERLRAASLPRCGVARAVLPRLCANAHQLIPAAAAVKAAAANEQHNHNDDDEGGGVHNRSSALSSAFECKGRG